MPKRDEIPATQMVKSGWDYMVRRPDGSLIFYSEHDEVAEWIKEDIDAGHEVTRVRLIST